ncbi:MAG: 4-hydroxy-3-methylbut-2-enyl diphosphate reductase [Lachnospiraceae bacterium]|nr:4-hydroxy-3-methylbut-2-enyl diphosphate reductase [Lachnospiraceae bacterium]MDD6450104.1 4-hydroxy-3-methylbut-2-enyl diphosphate reductase [Lachnospiraceae bacterium]MDD6451716.1 4-hydroxy-3-methylbut-2-enyl diphosphate reductase [Lachnospiraceae bacterium]MDD6578654.1 4-hydroxy-3-methylbut-2-enyl diphosphate reductase [Lachnospiraceae bacterium]
MKVLLAQSAGFCFGVKRALDTVEREIEKADGRPIYTYGPIIHNEIVVDDLKARGVRVMDENCDLDRLEKGTVIIRSHGVSSRVMEELKQDGFDVVDATCPFVLKIHRVVNEYAKKGYHIIITGNREHPEVEGIIGWIPGDDYEVIGSREEAEAIDLPPDRKICLVSQTTFNYKKFEELVEIIENKGYSIFCLNTICSATAERQNEAAAVADKVDVMIVIGGKHSSNSQKLYEICKEINPRTFFIQSRDDLDLSVIESIDSVGITAGASTPQKIIQEVQETCQNRALRKC